MISLNNDKKSGTCSPRPKFEHVPSRLRRAISIISNRILFGNWIFCRGVFFMAVISKLFDSDERTWQPEYGYEIWRPE